MTVVRSGSATDVGRVRASNQDVALEAPNIFAVADGMGGHVGGEVAARVAVEALQQTFARQPSAEGLLEAVVAANGAVWSQSQEQHDLRGMGTTLTAAALVAGEDSSEDVMALANVGDSRAYVVGDGRLTQVTADHSLAEERVRQGVMTEQEAAVHPHRHILTRALGIAPGVDVDLWELRLRTGDRLLLCSDGLTNEVPDDEIAEVLQHHAEPAEAAEALVRMANDHGGNDNITVVVVDVLVGEEGTEEPAGPTTVAAVPLEGVPAGAGEKGAGASPSVEAVGARRDLAPGDTTVVPAVSGARDDRPGPSSDGRAGSGSGTQAPPSRPGSAGPQGRARATAVQERPPPAEAAPATKRELRRQRRAGQPRRITVRVVLFVLLVIGVGVAAYYVVRWYALDNYYVAVNRGALVVYQGHPGGFMGFQPRLAHRSQVTTAQILPGDVPAVQRTVTEPSLSAAERYITNLRQEAIDQQNLNNGTGRFAGPPTTLPSSTTTLPPPPPTLPTTAPPLAPGAPAPAPAVPTTTP